MTSLPINLVKYSVRNYAYRNNIRLLSNTVDNNTEDSKSKNRIVQKFIELNNWYVKFTGLDELKKLQDRVILTQEKLEKAQEERREAQKILAEVRKKATELQEQLHNTKRWENVQKFLELTKQETEVIKIEKELATKFELLDKTEREIFTALSNAVRDSHEKERAQSEYTKYWGIILSIIGTIVGAVVSTLISTIRNHQIVSGITNGVEEKFEQMAGIIAIGGREKLNIEKIVKQINNDNNKNLTLIINKISDSHQRLSDLISYNTSVIDIRNNNKLDSFLKSQNSLLKTHQNEIKKLVATKTVDFSGEPNWIAIGGLLLLGIILGKACC